MVHKHHGQPACLHAFYISALFSQATWTSHQLPCLFFLIDLSKVTELPLKDSLLHQEYLTWPTFGEKSRISKSFSVIRGSEEPTGSQRKSPVSMLYGLNDTDAWIIDVSDIFHHRNESGATWKTSSHLWMVEERLQEDLRQQNCTVWLTAASFTSFIPILFWVNKVHYSCLLFNVDGHCHMYTLLVKCELGWTHSAAKL